LDLFSRASIALLNTAKTTIVSDSKEKKQSLSFDPALIAVFKPMFSSERKYRFRLTYHGNITTSGSATLALVIPTSLNNYSEGTVLTALFDFVKMTHTSLSLALCNAPGSNQFAFAMGFENTIVTGTPTFASVVRLPNSILATTIFPDTRSMALKLRAVKREFGLTSDEGVSAPRTFQGMAGTYLIVDSGGGTPPTSVTLFTFNVVSEAIFTGKT